MRLCQATLREIQMPLVRPFETSFGRTAERRILLVEVDADGVAGWSECVAGERPSYSSETIETAWHILRDFIWPMLVRKEISSAADVWELLAPIRGHNMAKAAIEAAVWDAEARQKNVPLWKLIGGTLQEIPCGVSIGIQESDDELERLVEKELAAGYQRIKIKIKPGWDVDVVRAVRERFPAIKLMAAANSAYRLSDAARLKELDAFYLMMIEQPLAHDDIIDHAKLQAQLDTPICLDECIRNAHMAEQAIEMRACGIINIKLGRVGGFAEARRVHDACRERGIPVWCGGMLESGVGRAHNIALSTLENFVLPGDVSASRRYWKRDIIIPPVEVTPQGTIQARDDPGFGHALDLDYLRQITVREETLR
jgi:O-succinylbenzoate synthase